jgi:hypothetical protein
VSKYLAFARAGHEEQGLRRVLPFDRYYIPAEPTSRGPSPSVFGDCQVLLEARDHQTVTRYPFPKDGSGTEASDDSSPICELCGVFSQELGSSCTGCNLEQAAECARSRYFWDAPDWVATCLLKNNNICLVGPQRSGWIHRGPRLRVDLPVGEYCVDAHFGIFRKELFSNGFWRYIPIFPQVAEDGSLFL